MRLPASAPARAPSVLCLFLLSVFHVRSCRLVTCFCLYIAEKLLEVLTDLSKENPPIVKRVRAKRPAEMKHWLRLDTGDHDAEHADAQVSPEPIQDPEPRDPQFNTSHRGAFVLWGANAKSTEPALVF